VGEYQLKSKEFFQWKMDPAGQEFFQAIAEARQYWVEFFINGHSGESIDFARGFIKGLDEVINFEVIDR
jgi:hypothetical protein